MKILSKLPKKRKVLKKLKDLMFSSKIIFVNKGEFYEFLNELIDNDYQDISMEYIHSLKKNVIYDNELEKILQKVENDNRKKHKS